MTNGPPNRLETSQSRVLDRREMEEEDIRRKDAVLRLKEQEIHEKNVKVGNKNKKTYFDRAADLVESLQKYIC